MDDIFSNIYEELLQTFKRGDLIIPTKSYANNYSWKIVSRHDEDITSMLDPLRDDTDDKVLSSGRTTYVCFGRYTRCDDLIQLLDHRQIPDNIGVIFNIYVSNEFEPARNNICWWSPEQIEYWIDSLKQDADLDFEFRVVCTSTSSAKYRDYTISFDFSKLNLLQQKLVLFWTRNLYESPANFYVLDALTLKRKIFPEESLVNLLTLTTTCGVALDKESFRISSDQNFSVGGKFVSQEYLKSYLKKHIGNVTDIFHGGYLNYERIRESRCIFGEYLPGLPPVKLTVDGWFKQSPDRFEQYIKFYNLFKRNELQ